MGNCLNTAIQTVNEAANAIQDQQEQQQQPASKNDSASLLHYSQLPAGAEKHTVRNVYDGDTLTLTDERRVRFLGIDTPEIKEKQPFSQQAKEYTKSKCPNNTDIWLSFEKEKEDHYGRLLAHVWVQAGDNNSYLCVNEGLVAAGLASVYTPSPDKKTSNYDKLLQLQKNARAARLGIHSASSFDDKTVVKTANGSAYHVRSCEHLAKVRHLEELKISDAQDRGLHPCRTCMS